MEADITKIKSRAETQLVKYNLHVISNEKSLIIAHNDDLLRINGKTYTYLLASKQSRVIYWDKKQKRLFDHNGCMLLTSQEISERF